MNEGSEGIISPTLSSHRLYIALGEQLKIPLMQIARNAELSRLNKTPFMQLHSIEASAHSALRLIDSYLLGAQTQIGQISLPLEPVAISSVLRDVAIELESFAELYGCQVIIQDRKHCPVAMSNSEGLRAALVSLGAVFIESVQHQKPTDLRQITLIAERHADGVMAGILTTADGLNEQLYKNAGRLYGRAHLPLGTVMNNSGAGIAVAQTIVGAMTSQLRAIRRYNKRGIAAILPISKQLKLII